MKIDTRREVLKVASELIMNTWPSEYWEDWNFPKNVSLKYRRKVIKEAKEMQDRMRRWSIRLSSALREDEKNDRHTKEENVALPQLQEELS